MKTYRPFYYLLSTLFSLMIFACTPIDKDDYLVDAGITLPDESGDDTDAPVYYKSVLVEDFTGQTCVNCPEAAEIIDQLHESYGDKIVAVGIHSMPLGFAGNARNIGLMTDLGKSYGEHWQVTVQPIGLINRAAGLLDRSQWFTAVAGELTKQTPLGIALQCDYDEATQTAAIRVDLTANSAVSGKLQVWITQDGIVAMQKTPTSGSGYDRTYVHNHVLRAAVNGSWGEDVSVSADQPLSRDYSFALTPDNHQANQPDYIPENCSVVAFVYDSNGVIQAKSVKIKQ